MKESDQNPPARIRIKLTERAPKVFTREKETS
jgi:hypothetical protein